MKNNFTKYIDEDKKIMGQPNFLPEQNTRKIRLMTQFEVINAIYDSKLFSKIKLTAGARLVLISLARHYNPLRQDSFPSYSCIAEHTGVSKKSVERAIKELTDKGLVTYTTEKVNHYRFTDYFFGVVKMTTDYRQNDGVSYRQNDDLTNNPEKINKKGFFEKFFKKAGTREEKKGAGNFGQDSKAAQAQNNLESKQQNEFNNAPAKKIDGQCAEIATNDAAFADYSRYSKSRSYKEYYKGLMPSEPLAGAPEAQGQGGQRGQWWLAGSAAQTAQANNAGQSGQPGQAGLTGQGMPSGVAEQAQVYKPKTSSGHGFATDGGGSRVPSAEETQKYLNEMRNSRQFACCPLEFEEERAKRWYASLNALLRTSVMAKKVAEKYNL